MAMQVKVHPKVNRQLAALEKQAKNPSIVAARARRIIDALIRGMPLASAGLMKRKTDRRVKDCLKFDLGKGFRLICIKKRRVIYVLFVGDHGNCDNWLDNYSKKNPLKEPREMQSCPVDNRFAALQEKRFPIKVFPEDSDGLQLSQRELRRVFKGLTG